MPTNKTTGFAFRFENRLASEQIANLGDVMYHDDLQGYEAISRRPRKRRPTEISDDDLLDITGGLTATGVVTYRFASYNQGVAAVSKGGWDKDVDS